MIHAEETFGSENPYLTTRIFNVEEPLSGSDDLVDRFDLVIATNVLHATRDIRETLRNAKAVMRKNGIVVINEMSDKSLFAHLTFGLLEGWWLYQDALVRIDGSPGIYPNTWKRVLKDEGFQNVSFPVENANDLKQQIIVAESDGIVRFKRLNVSSPQSSQKDRDEETSEQKFVQENIKQEGVSKPSMVENARSYIKELVAKTLKMPVAEIKASHPFEKYGMDSKQVNQLITQALSVLHYTT